MNFIDVIGSIAAIMVIYSCLTWPVGKIYETVEEAKKDGML